MTALQLYKFVFNNNLEYHVQHNDLDHAKVYLHVPFLFLHDFQKLMGYNFISKGAVVGTLCEYSVCFEMREICEQMDIECFDVFDKNI